VIRIRLRAEKWWSRSASWSCAHGRNALQLATLLPGVTRAVIKTALDGGNRGANYLNIKGAHQNEVDWQLDGIHYAGANNNSGLNLPSPDALAEFKLITNSYRRSTECSRARCSGL